MWPADHIPEPEPPGASGWPRVEPGVSRRDPGPDAGSGGGRTGGGRTGGGTLAFVESPVQLLNVLEWAHTATAVAGGRDPEPAGSPEPPEPPEPAGSPEPAGRPEGPGAPAPWDESEPGPVQLVVLPPHDPMTRGQLRRMAELARDEGHSVRWAEARGGASAPVRTVGSLAGPLRRASRVVLGDPFSRYVQLLLNLTSAAHVVVVDDGTATMEFVAQLARGERLTRWHQHGSGGPAAALFSPVARRARRRLVPSRRRSVELFSSMPVDPEIGRLGVTVTPHTFAWTRSRFGPPRLTHGSDLVGTSLVETGVMDAERYLTAVTELARHNGATRYFAHRRESAEKLHRVSTEAGLQVVRPDLPLELVARRGPVSRTVLSFPSTVVHTLPLALRGTAVRVAVCEVDPAWLTEQASPRAQGFLARVTGTAEAAHRLPPSFPATP